MTLTFFEIFELVKQENLIAPKKELHPLEYTELPYFSDFHIFTFFKCQLKFHITKPFLLIINRISLGSTSATVLAMAPNSVYPLSIHLSYLQL